MQTPTRFILPVVLLSAAPLAMAADKGGDGPALPVDISKWECKFCAFEAGQSSYVEGLGYLSDDSFKFGEYTGLTEKGPYVILDALYGHRDKDARYIDLDARNLGLDSRAIDVEGGKQGKYELFLDYYELPHFISDSAVTPFIGSGGDVLNLPPGWMRSGSTDTMPQLNSNLHQEDVKTKRKSLGLGVRFFPGRKWQSTVKGRHEIKEGTQKIAGAFWFDTVQFLQPVDYVTDELDVSATYSGRRLQARFAYYGSIFNNKDESLTWDNPFTSFFNADQGRLALPPDNQFHQLLASVGYQINKKTRLTADLTAGRGEQDEDFLPYTINPTVGVQPLPRASLDGRVDTLTAYVRLNSAITERWQFNAAYKYNDRDNKTPQETYTTPVNTDSTLVTAQTNVPYSFTADTLNLSVDYRFAKKAKGSVGFDYEAIERTFQEVDETEERTLWGKINARTRGNLDILFKAASSFRSASDYTTLPDMFRPQNPLMRIYNMAERERVSGVLQANATPHDKLAIGASFEFANSDYDDSVIGLLESEEFSVNFDASVQAAKKTSLHFFLNHQLISSEQAGSSTFGAPNWFQEEDDTFDTAGIGFKHMLIKNKIDIGADYMLAKSRGEIEVRTLVPNPPFPDLTTRLNSLKFYVDWRFKTKLSLNAAIWYEDYDSDDWQVDGVAPDTIPNVLSLGETSPSYDLYFLSLSVRYKF